MAGGRGPKDKGSNYEREVAAFMNEKLFGRDVVRRRLLSGGGRSGGGQESDLEGTKPFHMELKRTEKVQVHEAMKQAETSKKGHDIPVVVTRRNKMSTGESLVIMRLSDFLLLAGQQLIMENPSVK